MEDTILSQPPIACSLSPQDLSERQATWQSLMRSSLLARRRVAGGIRLTVRPDDAQAMHSLVELERQCCPWMKIVVTGDSVTVTADGDGEAVVVAMLS
jgi:hypothetical protein